MLLKIDIEVRETVRKFRERAKVWLGFWVISPKEIKKGKRKNMPSAGLWF